MYKKGDTVTYKYQGWVIKGEFCGYTDHQMRALVLVRNWDGCSLHKLLVERLA